MSNQTTMVSRSLRIKPETLKVLQTQAEDKGMGITVYIRFLLEKHVEGLSTGTFGGTL